MMSEALPPFPPSSTPPAGMTPELLSSPDHVLPPTDDHDSRMSAEDALYRALAAGRYLLFIGRIDHLGAGGLNWYMRQQDFPREDQRQAPEALVRLLEKARDREFSVDAERLANL